MSFTFGGSFCFIYTYELHLWWLCLQVSPLVAPFMGFTSGGLVTSFTSGGSIYGFHLWWPSHKLHLWWLHLWVSPLVA